MSRSLFISCRPRSRCNSAKETKTSDGTRTTRLESSVLAGGTDADRFVGLSHSQHHELSGASCRHRPGGNRSSPKV
jgi:hypothetical protein